MGIRLSADGCATTAEAVPKRRARRIEYAKRFINRGLSVKQGVVMQ
jgi:hypothetical protein